MKRINAPMVKDVWKNRWKNGMENRKERKHRLKV